MVDRSPQPGASFFRNTACPHFPCHAAPAPEEFNCLLCYCPLYALGPRCGGDFSYTQAGVKVCSSCSVPHEGTRGAQLVRERFAELAELARA